VDKVVSFLKTGFSAIVSVSILAVAYIKMRANNYQQKKGIDKVNKKELSEIEKRNKDVDKATDGLDDITHDKVRREMEKNKWFRD
jgi:uncharacterized protein YlxW (UPF0749 family)